MSNIRLIDQTSIGNGGRPAKKRLEYVRFELNNQLLTKIGQRFPGIGRHVFFELWSALGRYDYQVIGPLDVAEDLEDFFCEIQCDQEKSLPVLEWLADREVIDSILWKEARIIWCQDHLNYHEDAWKKRGRIPTRPIKIDTNTYRIGLDDYRAVSDSISGLSGDKTRLSDSEKGLSVAVTPQRKGKERKLNKRKGKEAIPPDTPSLKIVIEYFLENGYNRASAIKFHETYSPGWIDTRGNPIKNWKNKAQKIWFVPEHETPTNNSDQKILKSKIHTGFKADGEK